MELLVRNAEGNLSARDREYAAKKLGRLDRYFHAAQKVEMVHREGKLLHRIEITVFADGLTLRGEESDASISAAIDKVAEKMENRLRRFKSRLIKSHRTRDGKVPAALQEAEPHEEAEENHSVLEIKRFPTKPMSVEEATLQMELLQHAFFAFLNQDSGQVEVLYKRNDGGYGLLQPYIA